MARQRQTRKKQMSKNNKKRNRNNNDDNDDHDDNTELKRERDKFIDDIINATMEQLLKNNTPNVIDSPESVWYVGTADPPEIALSGGDDDDDDDDDHSSDDDYEPDEDGDDDDDEDEEEEDEAEEEKETTAATVVGTRKTPTRKCKEKKKKKKMDESKLQQFVFNSIKSTNKKRHRRSVRAQRSHNRKKRRAAIPNEVLPEPPMKPTDLASLIKLASMCKKRLYRDCQRLSGLYDPLIELQGLVGHADVKQRVFNMILRLLQNKSLSVPELGHILLYGAPGTGKTTLAGILAKILAAMGRVSNSNVVHATRSSLIGKFLGHTAPRTKAVLESAIGGVLLLDEASSLSDGRGEGSGDSFSKECLDVINRFLSERGTELVVILAGYENAITRDLFSVNIGLARRFTTTFRLKGYTNAELKQITLNMIKAKHLKLDEAADKELDEKKFDKELFNHWGGDAMVLVDEIITAHALNVFGSLEKGVISVFTIKAAWKSFEAQKQSKTGDNDDGRYNFAMYT